MQILVYDDTFALIRKTLRINAVYGLLLIVFIIIGAFTVLNMLIGIWIKLLTILFNNVLRAVSAVVEVDFHP